VLRADAQALRNLARTAEGRKVLLAQGIVLLCLVVGSMAITSRFLLDEELLQQVRADSSGDLLRLYYGMSLLLPLMLVLGVGGTQFKRALFAAPELPLLLTSPRSSFAIVGRSFTRTLAGWLLVGTAIGVPPILGLADRSAIPVTPILLLPLALTLVLAPLAAALALFQVAIVRWLSRPSLRRVLTVLHLAMCLGLALLLLSGMLRGPQLAAWIGEGIGGTELLPWWLRAPAALLGLAAGFEAPRSLLLSNLVLLVLPLPLIACTAWIHRRAFESHLVAFDPVGARTRRRTWPVSIRSSFMRKSTIGVLRVRSNLVFYGLVGVGMVAVLEGRPVAEAHDWEPLFPAPLRQAFGLLMSWYGMNILIACLAFMGMISGEQKQVALLTTTPFPRRQLLQVNLLWTASPFLFSSSLVLIGGPLLAGASLEGLGLFILFAIPMMLYLLGLVAAVGTWPTAIGLHDELPLASSLRSILPVMVIGLPAILGMSLMTKARHALTSSYHEHGPLAGFEGHDAALLVLGVTWMTGCLVFTLGYRLAVSNLERLLGPQAQ
jgi:hypothetical protein